MLASLIKQILAEIGEDASRPGLAKTPERTAAGFIRLFKGYKANVAEILSSVQFEKTEGNNIVLIPEIDVFSMCEHHFLPMVGKAHLAYVPSGKIAGIGSIAAVLEAFTFRLQVQERITSQVASALFSGTLEPKGVAVIIEMSHFCAVAKGDTYPHKMKTTAFLGEMQNPERKAELFSLLSLK